MGIFLLVTDYFRKESLKPFLFMFVSLPLLIYIPLFNREPYIFIGGNGLRDYWNYFFSQGGLTGGLAIVPPDDLIKRALEFTILAFASIGFFLPFLRSLWRNPVARLPFLAGLVFAVYYFSNLNPQTFTYLVPSVALLALAFGRLNYSKSIQVMLCSILLLIIVGNSILLRPDHSAALNYYNQLSNIPSDSVVWSKNRGWEKTTAELYNYENGTSIDQITLRKPAGSLSNIIQKVAEADQQNRLYMTRVVNTEAYHVIIVRASSNEVISDYLNTDMPR